MEKEILYCKGKTKQGRQCLGQVAHDGYCFVHWSKLKFKKKR